MAFSDNIATAWHGIWLKCKPLAAVLLWVLVILYFAFFSLCAVTRWYLLPQVGAYKAEIAELISKATGTDVSIGEIRPEWTQFWPQLTLKDLRLSSPRQREGERDSLVLNRVSVMFHWRSLLGSLSLRRLEIGDSHLSVKKLPDGSFEVGGIHFSSSGKDVSETDNMVIGWLLNQRHLYITNSSIDFSDLSGAEAKSISLRSLNVTFKKQLRSWVFGLQAVQHSPGAPKIDLRGNFSPSLFRPSTDWTGWKGEFYALLEDVNAHQLVADTPLQQFLRAGFGTVELIGSFQSGKLSSLDARTCLSDIDLRLDPSLPPLLLKEFSTHVSAQYDGKDANLSITDLVFQPEGGPLSGPAQIHAAARFKPETFDPVHSSVSVQHIDLAKLHNLTRSLPVPEAVLKTLDQLSPRGIVQAADFRWEGDIRAPGSWSVTSEFSALGLNPIPSGTQTDGIEDPGIPGFSNISGKASVSNSSGLVEINSTSPTLTFPGIFEHPRFQLNALSGIVRWGSQPGRPLKVSFEHVVVDSPSAHLVTQGSWTNTGGAGTIDVTGKAHRGRAQDVWLFMPLVIPKDVRDWLQAGLVRGRGDNCDVVLKGDLNDFPWQSEATRGKGTFYIKTDVSGVALDYVPSHRRDAEGHFERGSSWPLLTDISGTLTFRGMEMTVEANSADTQGAHVTRAWAQIPSLIDSNARLLVDGEVETTALSNGVAYLAKSPVGAILGNAFAKTKANGDIGLNLKLDIPLLHAKDTRVQGLIHFRGNSVAMGWPVPPVTALNGDLTFTHEGASSSGLTALAFGNPVSATAATAAPGVVRVKLSGSTDVQNITFFENGPTALAALKPLSGKTNFDAELMIGKELSVLVNTDLAGVSSAYPAPLSKQPEERWPTKFSLLMRGKQMDIELRAANKFQLLEHIPADKKAQVTGSITIGKTAQMPRSGLSLEINAKQAVADLWEAPIRSIFEAVGKEMSQSKPGDPSVTLTRMNVDIDSLTADDLVITDVKASAVQGQPGKWHIVVNSDQIVGSANWDLSGGNLGSVNARFSKLHIPGKSSDRIKTLLESSDRAALPSITASIQEFQYGGIPVGLVRLDAKNTTDSQGPLWRINSLTATNNAGSLKATGYWRSKSGTNVTTLQVQADIKDTGKLLSSMGIKDAISGASGKGTLDISWQSVPWQPLLESLQGNGSLNLEKGNLNQVSTGAGGVLLSVVSMQSLLKRLTLDFSDLSRGLAFDTFGGTFVINAGTMRSEDFKIASSKAAILISGEANLPAENLDFNVLVIPDVNALGASLALTVVNPVVGIGSFLAQLVLRNPLSNMFSMQYTVKGSFSDPIITKVQRNENKPSLIQGFSP